MAEVIVAKVSAKPMAANKEPGKRLKKVLKLILTWEAGSKNYESKNLSSFNVTGEL